ncbi:hypothetical protein [Variovorax sp. W2I14]|uniref:hypothetical protein n=1 Tax=Variovorax sp. W2I14 TaxID=3042290 RepID=UPI003D1F0733
MKTNAGGIRVGQQLRAVPSHPINDDPLSHRQSTGGATAGSFLPIDPPLPAAALA